MANGDTTLEPSLDSGTFLPTVLGHELYRIYKDLTVGLVNSVHFMTHFDDYVGSQKRIERSWETTQFVHK